MSVSHDIIMIEHNSKLPKRVLFCCFLCTVCSIVSDSLMLAMRVILLFSSHRFLNGFRLSYTFQIALRFSLGSEDV